MDIEEPVVKRKRGRPPKVLGRSVPVQRRNDPEDAPVGGAYRPLDVINKNPGYHYLWCSAPEMGMRRFHGYLVESWGPDSAKSPWDTGTDRREGEAYTVNELTLMKIANERFEKIQAAERAPFNSAIEGLSARAEATGGYMRNVPL